MTGVYVAIRHYVANGMKSDFAYFAVKSSFTAKDAKKPQDSQGKKSIFYPFAL